jgi:hypothetical protein
MEVYLRTRNRESESELSPFPLVEERLNVTKKEVICREAKPIIETEL